MSIDYESMIKKPTTVKEMMRKRGYELIGTGGGCTAYCKTFESIAWYILITSFDGADAPDSFNEKIIIGLYDSDDTQLEHRTLERCGMMKEFDGAFDRIENEYIYIADECFE